MTLKIAFIVPDNRDEFKQFDVPEPFFGPAPQALLDGLAELPECEVHIISTARREMKCPPRRGSNIFLHSLLVRHLGRVRHFYAGGILAIRRRLREIKPDIVHGQGSERYPALAASYSGFPNIVTIHGLMSNIAVVEKAPPFSFLRMAARLERHALKRTDGVICLSQHARKSLEPFNRNLFVIPNAVPNRYFEIKRAPVSPPEIICPAHIYGLKNQRGLIEGLDSLAARIPLKLTLLGKATGDDASRYVEKLAATRSWCHLAGLVDGPGMLAAIARAAVLVLPSFEENCPMSILEGMAAGIPIAASRAGGIPDLVQDGVTGVLFDPHRPESIREAIERLLLNRDYAQKLGEAGRERAQREFRPKAVAARHLELYAQFSHLGRALGTSGTRKRPRTN